MNAYIHYTFTAKEHTTKYNNKKHVYLKKRKKSTDKNPKNSKTKKKRFFFNNNNNKKKNKTQKFSCDAGRHANIRNPNIKTLLITVQNV